MEKVLAFEVWGDYAHFRTYYTTSSPLSFACPPKPTIYGMIGAIIGLEKNNNEYLKHFQDGKCRLAICIATEIRKVRWTLNLINTKGQTGDQFFLPIKKSGHEPRTQIRTEFVKDPRYLIYCYHYDSFIYNALKSNLSQHTSIYTASFGLSELLVNFEFKGEVAVIEKFRENWIKLNSIVPESFLIDNTSVKLEPGAEIFQFMVPIEMDPDRVVNRYERIFFERSGKPHDYRVTRYWETGDGKRIILF